MARGETVVTFDFEFSFSKGGQFVPANRIVVRAPGVAHLDIHSAMKAYASKVAMAMSEFASRAKQVSDEDDTNKPDPDAEQDVMALMAMGLGTEEFPKFVQYVKRALSNRHALASVGDYDPANPTPITDEVWDQLESAGGMEAIDKVMSAFTNFFFEALLRQNSRTKNGSADSHGSAPATKAPLPTSRRERTRSSA